MRTITLILFLILTACTRPNKGYIVEKTFIPAHKDTADEYSVTVVDTIQGHLYYYKSVDIPQRIFFKIHYGDFVYLDSLIK